MASFSKLPIELIIHIVSQTRSFDSVSALSKTSHFFNSACTNNAYSIVRTIVHKTTTYSTLELDLAILQLSLFPSYSSTCTNHLAISLANRIHSNRALALKAASFFQDDLNVGSPRFSPASIRLWASLFPTAYLRLWLLLLHWTHTSTKPSLTTTLSNPDPVSSLPTLPYTSLVSLYSLVLLLRNSAKGSTGKFAYLIPDSRHQTFIYPPPRTSLHAALDSIRYTIDLAMREIQREYETRRQRCPTQPWPTAPLYYRLIDQLVPRYEQPCPLLDLHRQKRAPSQNLPVVQFMSFEAVRSKEKDLSLGIITNPEPKTPSPKTASAPSLRAQLLETDMLLEEESKLKQPEGPDDSAWLAWIAHLQKLFNSGEAEREEAELKVSEHEIGLDDEDKSVRVWSKWNQWGALKCPSTETDMTEEGLLAALRGLTRGLAGDS